MYMEITKMVYQHPWYVSSVPHTSNGRLGVVFISPTEKVAVGVKFPRNSGRLPPDASGRRCAALEPYCNRLDATVLRSVGCRQRPVACLPSPLPSVRSLVQRPVTTVSSFLRDLAYGLVPIFMLGLCLRSSLVLLKFCLRC